MHASKDAPLDSIQLQKEQLQVQKEMLAATKQQAEALVAANRLKELEIEGQSKNAGKIASAVADGKSKPTTSADIVQYVIVNGSDGNYVDKQGIKAGLGLEDTQVAKPCSANGLAKTGLVARFQQTPKTPAYFWNPKGPYPPGLVEKYKGCPKWLAMAAQVKDAGGEGKGAGQVFQQQPLQQFAVILVLR